MQYASLIISKLCNLISTIPQNFKIHFYSLNDKPLLISNNINFMYSCSIQPTSLWGRCNIVSPQTCNISINGTVGTNTSVSTDSPGTPASTDSPGNNDGTSNTATSHPGTSDGNDDGKCNVAACLCSNCDDFEETFSTSFCLLSCIYKI